jgi:serine/threonine protein phosphatase PrpC
MTIVPLIINLLAFFGLSVILYFRFKNTPNKQELAELAAQISDINRSIERFAELKFIEENFAHSSELKSFSENLIEKLDQTYKEIQKIMEAQTELEKANESKMSIEEANKEFVTKDTADEVFAKKVDAENAEKEISSQLQEIGKSLIDLQKALEDMKSNTIPEAISQFIDKAKDSFDKLVKEVQEIALNSSDIKSDSQKKDLSTESKGENVTTDTNTSTIDKEKDLAFENQIKAKQIVLSNGKMNQPYSCPFDISTFGIAEIGDFVLIGLDSIGLTYDRDAKEIKGVPTLSGDHKIKIEIKRTDWSEGKPKFVRELNLIINPDPKSLWNNLPTPKDIEYYKPDEDKLFVKIDAINGEPRKDMVAASQRGRSHAHEAKARDDDFQLYYDNDNEWYILAVADGAGSAKSSRKGSAIATQVAVDVCKTQINQHNEEFCKLIKGFSEDKSDENRKKFGDYLYTIVGSSIFKAYKAIEDEAKIKGNPIKDYSTTLIFSICKKFSFGWFVGAYWVGDGGIGIYNKETQFLKVLGETDGGEFAGQTRFLTMAGMTEPTELYRRLRFDIVDDFTALILMSDGITDPKFETDANLLSIEKWNELWQDLSNEVDFSDDNEASADQLLKWLDFWSPGNHDDRTIAILF